MKKTVSAVLLLAAFIAAAAQKPYHIDITGPETPAAPVELDLGGSNPGGGKIAVNNEYISVDNKPFFPVMGEFHFSRYPRAYWEESILKIKAGGINVIATYVFWNLHEPGENVFDWSGDRDLRQFISLCAKHHINTIVRIGPYGHGEIRNGAIPDWLYGRPIDIRTDDPAYLAIVKRYYSEIAIQLKGLLYKDGGNVIGIQLENEYQHAGSAWWLTYPNSPNNYTFPYSQLSLTKANTYAIDRKQEYRESGDKHMITLKRIAKDCGLDVPLYTATGWGYAAIVDKGSLPVSAAYAYPSWGNLEPSPFYLFKDLRKDPDYGPVRYEPQRYPSIAAEIGSGIMVTNSKRPLVPAKSITPLMVRNIGSGSNGIGYYMYHGGTTPVQNGQFMSEEPGELPKVSYDFQAPVGEFGQVRASYKELVPLHFFLQAYGSRLAPMCVFLPATNPATATDTTHLRYSIRADGNSGFVFMHNYQDHVPVPDLNGLQLSIQTRTGTVNIPEDGSFTLKKENYAILPFNLLLDDVLIRYSTTQPFTSFERDGTAYYVFTAIDGIQPEFYINTGEPVIPVGDCTVKKKKGATIVKGAGNLFSFRIGNQGKSKIILVIPTGFAKNAYPVKKGLLFSDETVLLYENGFEVISRGKDNDTITFYPAPANAPSITNAAHSALLPAIAKNFSSYRIDFKTTIPPVKIEQSGNAHVSITTGQNAFAGLNDIFIKIDYTGDKGQALLDGRLVADHFYYGAPWEIGLKRFNDGLMKQPLYLFFQPINKNAPCLAYFRDHLPPFGDSADYLKINAITVIPEFKCRVELQ